MITVTITYGYISVDDRLLYLGVTLSNDLEWSKDIATMTNKANPKLSFWHCNLKGCPEK